MGGERQLQMSHKQAQKSLLGLRLGEGCSNDPPPPPPQHKALKDTLFALNGVKILSSIYNLITAHTTKGAAPLCTVKSIKPGPTTEVKHVKQSLPSEALPPGSSPGEMSPLAAANVCMFCFFCHI